MMHVVHQIAETWISIWHKLLEWIGGSIDERIFEKAVSKS